MRFASAAACAAALGVLALTGCTATPTPATPATATTAVRVSPPPSTLGADPTAPPDVPTGQIGTSVYTYDTGVQVSVPSLRRYPLGNIAGLTPGMVGFVATVRVHNGTTQPLDLAMASALLTSGDNGDRATPILPDDALGFGGKVAPGRTATGRFAFAVRPDAVGDASLEVTVDPLRSDSVLFTGTAR
jgi:hypothetical protein